MPSMPGVAVASPAARLKQAFAGADPRVCVAFWLFGLINNIFYVIILSAALDLVGPRIPKGTVLLASIIPGLATKIVVPYVIHLVPYSRRVILFTLLSTCGMLIVALSPSKDAGGVGAKIVGIILANISSGAGEVHFLALTHFYGHHALSAWGSGTGGAGLVGAGAYALLTTMLGFGVQGTLLASAIIPLGMVLSWFILLPLGPLRHVEAPGYQAVPAEEREGSTTDALGSGGRAGLLDPPDTHSATLAYEKKGSRLHRAVAGLQDRLVRARTLVIPYMLPLFLVYVAEYTINQGVAPTLLFPLKDSPFKHFRAFYPTYGAIYQLGVFISRSSLPFIRIRTLYVPSILQIMNLVALTAHALVPYIPNVWFVFVIVFWEGLLGGLVYVSTFAAIREEVAEEEREFSLGAVTVSDSGGIFVAGLLGVTMESPLCSWQVRHGRDWCRQL
ncbi:batten's disease protein Cln3 [Teratosphaeria nubilosa]|uniref:Protein BTN n=1 Tax=Teratosphaeria nubilosa TaxID=161662 RepID=A0A6G1L2D3_9PEZI|nr:batten's disease protein Cln3 [Teratosphaeria nubilosa]